jgi:hypothetical protein
MPPVALGIQHVELAGNTIVETHPRKVQIFVHRLRAPGLGVELLARQCLSVQRITRPWIEVRKREHREFRARGDETLARWAIKEGLRQFWNKPTREEALAHWKLWYRWATHLRLKPVIKTAKNIQHKLHNV